MNLPLVLLKQVVWFSLASVSSVWPIEMLEERDTALLLQVDSCTIGRTPSTVKSGTTHLEVYVEQREGLILSGYQATGIVLSIYYTC